jgi:hypothetical protein
MPLARRSGSFLAISIACAPLTMPDSAIAGGALSGLIEAVAFHQFNRSGFQDSGEMTHSAFEHSPRVTLHGVPRIRPPEVWDLAECRTISEKSRSVQLARLARRARAAAGGASDIVRAI